MKTVFTNAMCAHVWAQQTQEHGRGSSGSLYFRRSTIYSYGEHWPLAQIVTAGSGKTARKAVLVKNRYGRSRSITTSKHMGDVCRALSRDQKCKMFDVEFLGPKGVGFRQAGLDHAGNLASYVSRRDDAIAKAMRVHLHNMEYLVSYAAKWETEYAEYCRFFGIRRKIPKRNTYNGKFETRLERAEGAVAEYASIQAARAERARIEYEAKHAAEAIEQAKLLPGWLAGENHARLYALPDTYLRVRGENIETTRGATFPVEHGIRAFKLIRALVETGREYKRNGHTIHLGHFALDSISADGTVRAGCHTVHWPTIERVAWQLGLMEDCRPMYAGGGTL